MSNYVSKHVLHAFHISFKHASTHPKHVSTRAKSISKHFNLLNKTQHYECVKQFQHLHRQVTTDFWCTQLKPRTPTLSVLVWKHQTQIHSDATTHTQTNAHTDTKTHTNTHTHTSTNTNNLAETRFPLQRRASACG